jgi:miniconductance mechanosensitive channel
MDDITKINGVTKFFTDYIFNLLSQTGLSDKWAANISEILVLLSLFIISYIAYLLTWRIIRRIFIPLFKKSKNQFDDLLVKHSFFRRMSLLVPATILFNFSGDILSNFPTLEAFLLTSIEIFFVFIILLIVDSVLSTLNDYYDRFSFSKDHPIKGVVQIIKIVSYIIGILAITGSLFQKDLSSLLISLGTLSAVMMLIFKDPILGFVGGLQLIFNKMVSIGDWISMPKYGADGNILEINLTTVKVQNWDKTIVTLPTYSLISDSFQNWKGMETSGGRRIKRHISIDMDSVKFCTSEMLEKYKEIHFIKDYINTKQKEVEDFNTKLGINQEVRVNGRRQTNIGVFREYLKRYLDSRSDINKDMTFMVRQLQPTEKGIPMEVYVFTKTTAWIEYEGIMADIFDHIMAVVPEFGLKIYQFPKSGEKSGLVAE